MRYLIKLLTTLLLTVFIGVVVSCGDNSDSFNLQVEKEEEVVLDNASIKITLYGTDRTVADNTATVIFQSVLDIAIIPSTVSLVWPNNASELIDSPPVRSENDAIYYLTINIDSNNDDLLCDGDFRQDYNTTPFFTLDDRPTESVVIHVIEISNNTCEIF